MKLTASSAISTRQPDDDSLGYWINYEATPLLKDLRTFANQREVVQKTLITNSTAVLTTIYQEDMPFNGLWAVTVDAMAFVTPFERSRHTLSGLFVRSLSAAATQEGATLATNVITTDVLMTAALTASANGILVQVNDNGNGVCRWNVIVTIQEIQG